MFINKINCKKLLKSNIFSIWKNSPTVKFRGTPCITKSTGNSWLPENLALALSMPPCFTPQCNTILFTAVLQYLQYSSSISHPASSSSHSNLQSKYQSINKSIKVGLKKNDDTHFTNPPKSWGFYWIFLNIFIFFSLIFNLLMIHSSRNEVYYHWYW